jgi:hypothetical protein
MAETTDARHQTQERQDRSPAFFTMEEYRAVIELAYQTTSLVFWTRGASGDLQPLLMPVDVAVFQVQ